MSDHFETPCTRLKKTVNCLTVLSIIISFTIEETSNAKYLKTIRSAGNACRTPISNVKVKNINSAGYAVFTPWVMFFFDISDSCCKIKSDVYFPQRHRSC